MTNPLNNVPKRALRTGFSTGACTAAAVTAAWLNYEKGKVLDHIFLLFPDGKERQLSLCACQNGMASIIKDGGDDPDITHGMKFIVQIQDGKPADQNPEDYLLKMGKGTVILRAVEGVGICTRAGLDCEKGRWAINMGPRRMIMDNLQKAGFGQKEACIRVSLRAINGERIGAKTLNPTLGILGGISILGTSGIVHPYSHKAYIDTIRVQVRAALTRGRSILVLATGGRTKRGAQTVLTGVAEDAFICMGDYIGDSLRETAIQGIPRIVIACMPGKLCKYATGFENTHAHKNSQNMGALLSALTSVFTPDPNLMDQLKGLPSVRSALDFLPESTQIDTLQVLARQALKQLKQWNAKSRLEMMVFNFEGEHLFTTGDEE